MGVLSCPPPARNDALLGFEGVGASPVVVGVGGVLLRDRSVHLREVVGMVSVVVDGGIVVFIIRTAAARVLEGVILVVLLIVGGLVVVGLLPALRQSAAYVGFAAVRRVVFVFASWFTQKNRPDPLSGLRYPFHFTHGIFIYSSLHGPR